MANPALNEKRFEDVRKDWEPGWAAGETATQSEGGEPPPAAAPTGVMTANGTFAKTFALFILVLIGGAIGWSQADVSPAQQITFPAWSWVCLFGAFGLAMVCVFRPKASPFVAPFYALLEGVFLGVISKVFELHWNGIVLQAVLAVMGVFFATLALYVFGVVKVTRKFQMMVIGATCGIFLLYLFGALLVIASVRLLRSREATGNSSGGILQLVQRFIPVTNEYRGKAFVTRVDGRLSVTPLFVALVAIVLFLSSAICGQSPPPLTTDKPAERQLNMLVLGDSIMWGQGLNEQHKAWYQVKSWLKENTSREVRENVEAHSGWVILELSGPHDACDAAIAYLEEVGCTVNRMEGDVVAG
jgi:hypothetical protein